MQVTRACEAAGQEHLIARLNRDEVGPVHVAVESVFADSVCLAHVGSLINILHQLLVTEYHKVLNTYAAYRNRPAAANFTLNGFDDIISEWGQLRPAGALQGIQKGFEERIFFASLGAPDALQPGAAVPIRMAERSWQ